MAFRTDYDSIQRFILPAGDYEMVVTHTQYDTTRGGTDYVNIHLTVREDVEQPHKGQRLEHPLWKSKNPNAADMAIGGYSMANLCHISRGVGLPNDMEFESLSDWMAHIRGRAVRVSVEHEEYRGNTNARVKGFYSTRFPEVKHELPALPEAIVSDDELPF